MKAYILIIVFIFFASSAFSQDTNTKQLVDSIKYMRSTAIDCKAGIFWRIIKAGNKAIPYLIAKITDATPTTISSPCKKTKLNVGEVAYEALEGIAEIPMAVMTHMQYDVYDEHGCWSFYEYFYSAVNKISFQKILQDWFINNATKYKRKHIPVNDQTACQKLFKIDSRYEWSE